MSGKKVSLSSLIYGKIWTNRNKNNTNGPKLIGYPHTRFKYFIYKFIFISFRIDSAFGDFS